MGLRAYDREFPLTDIPKRCCDIAFRLISKRRNGLIVRKDFIHWAWVILSVCFIDLFINYSVRLGYSVVLPEMIRELGFNRTAGGSIFNAYLFSYIILTPLSGILTDRLGARRVISTCAFILGIGILLMGTVIGAWTPFYGAGAILVHWVSGVLRDTTGSYDQAFMINAVMAAIGIGLICAIKKS